MAVLVAPSGLTLDFRKIRGQELVQLAEGADEALPMGGFEKVLSACHMNTVDPGPYSFIEEGANKFDWNRIVLGDTLVAFIHVRRFSHPDKDMFFFAVRCEECGHRYDWQINLATQLKIQDLPETSRESLRIGQPLEAKVGERTVRYHLQNATQAAPMRAEMKRSKRKTATMVDRCAAQIVSIEGHSSPGLRAVNGSDVKKDYRAIWRAVSEFDYDEIAELRAEMDAADCGIDTEIQTRCTNAECRWEQDVTLPLGRSFFALRPRLRATESASFSERQARSGSGDSSTPSSGSNTEDPATI